MGKLPFQRVLLLLTTAIMISMFLSVFASASYLAGGIFIKGDIDEDNDLEGPSGFSGCGSTCCARAVEVDDWLPDDKGTWTWAGTGKIIQGGSCIGSAWGMGCGDTGGNGPEDVMKYPGLSFGQDVICHMGTSWHICNSNGERLNGVGYDVVCNNGNYDNCHANGGSCASDIWCCNGQTCSNGHCCPNGEAWLGTKCGIPCDCTASTWVGWPEASPTSCGNCNSGTNQRYCGSNCKWSDQYRCYGEGCSPGSTLAGVTCGNCGSQQKICTSSCTWPGSWSCIDEGECAVGSTKCEGSTAYSCGDDCYWDSENCLNKASFDSDGGAVYQTAGYVIDYNACSGGQCTGPAFNDACLNPTILDPEQVASDASRITRAKDCEDYEDFGCKAGKYYWVNWGCSLSSGRGYCNDAAATDDHVGTDNDGDGADVNCTDKLCDNNDNYVDSNRQCTPPQTRCLTVGPAVRYQTCPACEWNNTGINADDDNWDYECGDSLCDNVPGWNDAMIQIENDPALCSDGIDTDCDGLIDCDDPDCNGVRQPDGDICCDTDATLCDQDDCVDETCESHICTYTNRSACAPDECQTGYYCNIAGGDCTDADASQTVCTNCAAANWLRGNESAGFGGYVPTGREGPECCGNTPETEFYITRTNPAGGRGCCNEPTDCIDRLGYCRVGYENTSSLCTNGIDDDCDGNIDVADLNSCYGSLNGTIRDGDNPGWYVSVPTTVAGKPLNLPDGFNPDALEASGKSNSVGYYEVHNAFVGTYQFRASADGFQPSMETVEIQANRMVQRDFYLYRGLSCDENCLDQNGYCNPNCDGVEFQGGTCDFVHPDCAGRRPGFQINYLDAGNQMHWVTCCEGPETVRPAIKAKVDASTQNMYDYKRIVKIAGRSYWMHILVWR
ncbi:carboxypeptidase regulatory-like domain-containing protein [Candidatus Woesearchaeota archaeon]|nr:carboxypeptidase regulatory-like domain-containing protein [Candidatus Woesearchaeota archaeon]